MEAAHLLANLAPIFAVDTYKKVISIDVGRSLQRFLVWLRSQLRASEAVLMLLAVGIGAISGAATTGLASLAHGLQRILFGLPNGGHLSSVIMIGPSQLLVLPLGGLVVGLASRLAWRNRGHSPVDVVEANALLGGRVLLRDSLFITAQTLLSNGSGASVGLEAAYAQCGGAVASLFGGVLRVRRSDLRILVGAGAGAAIAAAFGAPLAGAFYAFEIVIGAYTPSAIAPVAAATLAGALVARAIGAPPYLVAANSGAAIQTADYLLFAGLGAVCASVGIALMRASAACERLSLRLPIAPWLRPMIGGILLMPIAFLSPQAISAGHGALNLEFAEKLSIGFLVGIILLKATASVVSLGFGYRGGLFFASLFLGSLIGQLFALVAAALGVTPAPDPVSASLVGMAALAVAVVGGPMTMALLVLEATHDFEITAVVIAASIVAGTIARERFGYSFSTWRLHLRGENIQSARDIGWMRSLTAGEMMRRDVTLAPETMPVAEFRHRYPPAAASRVVLLDTLDRYAGILVPAAAYGAGLDDAGPVSRLATNLGATLSFEMDIKTVMAMFDRLEADELAVTDSDRRVIGVLTEKYVRRRFADELEEVQRGLFGER